MKNNEEGEADKMSAQKRRNTLVGFGAVAIVLALAVAYFGPSFNYRDADASGAIGAVEKHRAPQITEADVVLGDEATKQQQQILYADFLTDAAALQNIAADLGSEDQAIGVRAASVGQRLAARQNELNVRYRAAANDFLAALEQLGAEEQLGRAAFANLAASVRQNLAARDMRALSARFSEVVDQLAIAPCCGTALNAQSFQDFESALGSADAESLDAAFNVNRLQSAFDADNLGVKIRSHAAYIEVLSNEAMTLDAVSRGVQAKSLNAHNLRQFSADLIQAAEQLEDRATLNMESNLASDVATLDAMGRVESRLNVVSESLDARRRSQLAAFSADFESRKMRMQARSGGIRSAQLAAINNHLEVRRNLGRRSAYLASAMDESNLAVFAENLAARRVR